MSNLIRRMTSLVGICLKKRETKILEHHCFLDWLWPANNTRRSKACLKISVKKFKTALSIKTNIKNVFIEKKTKKIVLFLISLPKIKESLK